MRLLTLALTAAVLLSLASCGASGPAGVVEAAIAAAKAKDLDALRSHVVKSERAIVVGAQLLDGDITVGSATTTGDRSVVACTANGKPMNVVVVKEDGDWRISMLATAAEAMKGVSGPIMDAFKDMGGPEMQNAMKGLSDQTNEAMKQALEGTQKK